ncbi:hypothetical protein GCM10009772_34360 [Pseudonocardia alni subsp. carboxydivorans]
MQEGVPVDGFTVVRCGACAHAPSGFDEDAHGTVAALPGVDEVLVEGLRAVVQDSTQGVLVTAGCRLGPGVCAARRPGLMVLVQACDAARTRPESPVVAVGRGPRHRRRPCGDPLAAGRRRPRPAGTARTAALRDHPGDRPRLTHAERLPGPPAVTSARGDNSLARARPGRAGSGSEHAAPGPDAVARPDRARDRRRPA